MNKFFRFEFKYQILKVQMRSLEYDLVRLGMKSDGDGSRRRYTVSSLYFDSPELSDYNDKSSGLLNRLKIRARIYGEDLSQDITEVWLEIKQKRDMKIYKRRVSISPEEWLDLSKNFHSFKSLYSRLDSSELEILREFIFHISSANRRPVVLIQYTRKPYTYKTPDGTMRITIDSNLRAANSSKLSPTRRFREIMPQYAIVEVKYSNFLHPFMKTLLKKYGLRRDAYSKYALGIEAVRKYNPLPR